VIVGGIPVKKRVVIGKEYKYHPALTLSVPQITSH